MNGTERKYRHMNKCAIPNLCTEFPNQLLILELWKLRVLIYVHVQEHTLTIPPKSLKYNFLQRRIREREELDFPIALFIDK